MITGKGNDILMATHAMVVWTGGTHRREDLWEAWEEVVETAPDFFFFKSPIPKDICFFPITHQTKQTEEDPSATCRKPERGACVFLHPAL